MTPSPADLGRVRTLLRLQLRAAETASWPAFHSLAAAIRDELALGAGPAAGAATAEIAHLQLRLESLLRQRTLEAAERLGLAAAGRAYRRLARRR